MYETNYIRATSVDEAVEKIGNADDGKFLAGGHTLIPTMKQRLAAPSDVIDLRHVEALKGISLNNDVLTIGAMTTHAEVANSDLVKSACPALADLASHIGDAHVRHMGTIGGSIANNDPAADYPAGLLALGATINTKQRAIAAGEFFAGLFETALEDGELIVSASVPACVRAAYQKFPNPASRYALAGVFVAQHESDVRVAVTGAGSDGVFRWSEAEAALGANFSADSISALEVNADQLMSDLHASVEYRANLIKVMAKRAVAMI